MHYILWLFTNKIQILRGVYMKLKEVRKLAINYCEENKQNYTHIGHDNESEFYLTDRDDAHVIFLVNRNGSLTACHNTSYAVDFHKELKRRKKSRRRNDKRKIAEIANRDSVNHDLADEE